MITWADAHRRGATKAAELHGDLEIDLTQPVDVFSAIERVGLVLAFAPLGAISGLYVPSVGTPGVMLHEGHPRTRQRYTAGHELGHHVFEHALEVDVDLESALRRTEVASWSDQEKEAEAFGAWFLMPRRLIRAGLRDLGVEVPASPFDAYALSLWLGTSYTATVRQLATTQIIDRGISSAWAAIPPKTIKEGLAGQFVPNDLHNDVWWLDGAHHHRRIEARPGDRVVLTLEENPSTGFSWEWSDPHEGVTLLADSFEDDWEPDFDSLDAGEEAVDGAPWPRTFVLEVDAQPDLGVRHLRMAKERPGGTHLAGEFELEIALSPLRQGVQEPESEYALAA